MAKTRLSVSIDDEVMDYITAAQQRYIHEGRKVTRILRVKPASEILVEAAMRGFQTVEPNVVNLQEAAERLLTRNGHATDESIELRTELQGKDDALSELRSILHRHDDEEGSTLVHEVAQEGRTMADLVRANRELDRKAYELEIVLNDALKLETGQVEKARSQLGEWATPERAVQALSEIRTFLEQQKPGWVDSWLRKQHPDWFEGE